MPFLAPILLFGAVFASAPIIIHLLNRRRFTLVEWAPMEYLKLTLRTNRRRLQLEQWILLAIRTLVILLLIFAVARPFLSGNAAGSWLSLGGRTSRVILIDDSLSMGLTTAGDSALKRASEQAALLIESVGSQDALTVATTSGLGKPMLRDSVLSNEEAAALAGDVRAIEPTEAANNWAATLSQAADLLSGAAHASRELRIFTDQRASGWSADAANEAAKLEALGVKVVIVNVGEGSIGNASMKTLDMATGVALVNTPIEFVAEVNVDDLDFAFDVEFATLIVDGVESPLKLPERTPGQAFEVRFKQTFDKPGEHTVQLRLPDDALPGDNERSLVVDVAKSVRVLLVDGEPGIAARDSEVFYAAQLLYSGSTPIKTTVLADSDWFDKPTVGNYDLVVLANVERVPAKRVQQLTAMVQAGCGLMVFTGDQVDPVEYSDLLYRGGQGLLPAAIELGEEVDVQGLIVDQVDGTPMPILAQIQNDYPGMLSRVAPRKITPVAMPERDDRNDTRVLARWNAPGLPPAAIEKRVGKGRVVLWTVTADRAWSDWPTEGSYIVGVRETALNIAGVSRSQGNLTAGQTIRQRVSASNPPSRADLVRPGEETSVSAEIDRSDASRPTIVFASTHQAGIYSLSWDVPGRDEPSTAKYALSPDERESDLSVLSEQEMQQMLPGVDLTLIDLTSTAAGGAEREIWRTLAMLLLGFVVIESAFATWVGRDH